MKPLVVHLTLAGLLLAGCTDVERKPTSTAPPTAAAKSVALMPEDPYLWLEETDSPKALDWVKARNADTVKSHASSPQFDTMRDQILEVMDSDARIPYVVRSGTFYYNFWRDKAHARGVWRRTTLGEYRKDQPRWETVIDLDALAKRKTRTGSGTAVRA